MANFVEMFARQKCASILHAAKSTALEKLDSGQNYLLPIDQRFKCKDYDRKFDTFQALGSHRASHMKLRLPNQDNAVTIAIPGDGGGSFAVTRFGIHECKECRERFPIGQALGGHMTYKLSPLLDP